MAKKWSYTTGVFGVLVFVAAQVVSGSLPKPDAAVEDVIQHLEVHRARFLAGLVIASIAAALLLVFASRLRDAMDDAEGGRSILGLPTFGAWLLLFAVIAAGQAPLAAVAWWGDGIAGDGLDTMQVVIRMAFDADNLALYALSAPFAALSILGPCLVAWRTGFLPKWLVALGAVEIAVNVVEVVGVATTTGANAAGYAVGAGPIIWSLWVACASIVLYRQAPIDA